MLQDGKAWFFLFFVEYLRNKIKLVAMLPFMLPLHLLVSSLLSLVVEVYSTSLIYGEIDNDFLLFFVW